MMWAKGWQGMGAASGFVRRRAKPGLGSGEQLGDAQCAEELFPQHIDTCAEQVSGSVFLFRRGAPMLAAIACEYGKTPAKNGGYWRFGAENGDDYVLVFPSGT